MNLPGFSASQSNQFGSDWMYDYATSPCNPCFLFTEKWEQGGRLLPSQKPPVSAPEGDKDPSPQPQLPDASTPGRRPP